MRRQHAGDFYGARAWFSNEAQVRLFFWPYGLDSVLKRKFLFRWVHHRLHYISRLISRSECEGNGIVVHYNRGNRGAIFPDHIVNFPAIRIALPREIAVIADDISANFLYAASDNQIRQFAKNFFWRTIEF